ncbi:MAG: proteasome accessory factor PafA2 family protein [Nitrospira sp.]|nr:proteasome accessory factor PafA2 family protein [Nitrospira sp.]MDH4357681.1 proteasome accessory factor PafA2 family protein [Nitrospira sp.]
MRLFGIETEYGITRDDIPEVDPVVESMELVRAHLEVSFERRWDYAGEDPHEDARGFRVSGLQQDREEDEFAKRDAHRPFSFHEMKSDLVLPNGARFYNDHTHPEYSTPECRTLKDLVAQDRAGERILLRAAQRRNKVLGGDHVRLYKNNTDFHGHSYGCHDNYLVARSIPFPNLVTGLVPFLVSRQVIAGAGKVGTEAQESGHVPGRYQLSQRADFMEVELGVDTMHNRPILNTRDEPHADRMKYRRLHLIIGDANMCEYATALKVGTTQLVLDLIERGAAPDCELDQPVTAVKQLSRDPDLKTIVTLRNGLKLSAVDIQESYCEAASRMLSGTDEETDWLLREWSETLSLLSQDRSRLVGKLDWVTKQWLLESFMREERIGWDDPWLASLDLEYHNIHPEQGLYLGLEAEGKAWRMATDEAIEEAMWNGPTDTRGGLRGLCVQRFPDQIKSMQWEHIQFTGGIRSRNLDMGDLFDPQEVRQCAHIFQVAGSPSEALAAWSHRKDSAI